MNKFYDYIIIYFYFVPIFPTIVQLTHKPVLVIVIIIFFIKKGLQCYFAEIKQDKINVKYKRMF